MYKRQFHAGVKLKTCQSLDGFVRGSENVDKPFVGALLELLSGIDVYKRQLFLQVRTFLPLLLIAWPIRVGRPHFGQMS